MNTLCNDIKFNFIFKYYLCDDDALSLFKTSKSQYFKIKDYKYKDFVDCVHLENYKNCLVEKIFNVSDLTQQRLPNSISHLIFCNYFDDDINGNLPNSLTHLTFGWMFNKQVANLPNSITHLTFGYYFNRPVKGNLPNSITHLTFGYAFKQKLKKLPNSITHLTLSISFRYPTDHFPSCITIKKV